MDREQLRITIKPAMTRAVFANWVAPRDTLQGFPLPVRTGARSVSWRAVEVLAWIETRARGGVFGGRRRPTGKAA